MDKLASKQKLQQGNFGLGDEQINAIAKTDLKFPLMFLAGFQEQELGWSSGRLKLRKISNIDHRFAYPENSFRREDTQHIDLKALNRMSLLRKHWNSKEKVSALLVQFFLPS
jgi:hypothetical protein